VVTGSLPVASLLGTRKGRVVVLGGSVLTDELACVGPVAAATVRRYHADLAVLGAAGLSAKHGITELSDEAAEIQRLMVEHSERLVIVADGSKLGQTAMASVTACDRISTLITDDGAPQQELLELEALGIEIVQVARPPRRAPARAGADGHTDAES
jgi:DeoR/GlpR family transcriptional regulator of sugar metabolism